MRMDDDTCYRALAARDGRFDGLFFVGVRTTGIYCRPVCTARTPRRDRCRFFANAALCERAGFRPCLRCRPELAPGRSPVDAVARTAHLAAARIEAGALHGGGVEGLAAELGLSGRQLRRAVRREFGVSPLELARTARLLLAKQLLSESSLPIVEVAFASGFESVRRFNALFRAHYGMTPSRLRREAEGSTDKGVTVASAAVDAGSTPRGSQSRGARKAAQSPTHSAPETRLRLTLSYRPPFAWQSLLRFLAGRATPGVECVAENAYLRTVELGGGRGWIRVERATGRDALTVEIAASLAPVLPALLARVRGMFDLSARPDAIAAHLGSHPLLADAVRRVPGLRVPGALDGFELAVRAILGQRLSVRGATTLAGRLAAHFGEEVETSFAGLQRLAPTAARLAETPATRLAALGIAPPRAASIRALARAVAAGRISLAPGGDPEAAMGALQELPGIGEWTAQYVVLHGLGWPDAFPDGDLGLLRASGLVNARALRKCAEAWRPWRSYAAMYLWESLPTGASTRPDLKDAVVPFGHIPIGVEIDEAGDTLQHPTQSRRRLAAHLGR